MTRRRDGWSRLPACRPRQPAADTSARPARSLDDIRAAQLPAFEDVKPQIAQQMQQQKMTAFQEELRKKAKIE